MGCSGKTGPVATSDAYEINGVALATSELTESRFGLVVQSRSRSLLPRQHRDALPFDEMGREPNRLSISTTITDVINEEFHRTLPN